MTDSRAKLIARLVLALVMIVAGISHFTRMADFVVMVPAWLPWPRGLVIVSGLCEIAGGVGLVVPGLRRAAAIGLVLLYIAVFPANWNMAVHNIQPASMHLSPLMLWIRLPFQALFIAWAWWVRRP